MRVLSPYRAGIALVRYWSTWVRDQALAGVAIAMLAVPLLALVLFLGPPVFVMFVVGMIIWGYRGYRRVEGLVE
jgi:hypothetical protein